MTFRRGTGISKSFYYGVARRIAKNICGKATEVASAVGPGSNPRPGTLEGLFAEHQHWINRDLLCIIVQSQLLSTINNKLPTVSLRIFGSILPGRCFNY